VIELKVDEAILLKRIENRVAEMRARGQPVRADDSPQVLRQRLATYRAQTAPLVGYYGQKGTLKAVDGMAPIRQVAAAIDRALAPGVAGKAAPRKTAPSKARRRKATSRKAKKAPGRKTTRKKPARRKPSRRRRLTKAR
jgi:adenylate kinase